jgi:shikimate 5-dehydrogenase
MNIKRAVVIGAGGGAVAVWLAAASTSVRRTPPPDVFKRTATDAKVDELDVEIARLRERLHPSSAPLQNRDLFRYTRSAAAAGRDVADADAAREPAPSAPVAVAPPLSLIGLAEEDGARTAIISGAGDLLFVKEGDVISSRYRVARIAPEGVELADTGDGAILRLQLK